MAALVGMADVTEIIETVIYTAYVRAKGTCSVMLVSPSGGGKSQSMLQFRNFPSVYIHNDLTTMRMADILERDREGKIRHFMLPDLNPTLSHKPAVVSLFLAALLSLQSEGMFDAGEGTRVHQVQHAPVGMITGCTPEMYTAYHRKLRILGLIRRNSPIFYTLGKNTVDKAQAEKKVNIEHVGEPIKPPKGLKPDRDVTIPREHAEILEVLSVLFTEHLSVGPVWHVLPDGRRAVEPGKCEVMLPLAPHDFLRLLAKGHALRGRREIVNSDDVAFVRRFVGMTKFGDITQL